MGAEITEKILVNGTDISTYGAKALRKSISVGGTAITNDYFQGRNRSNYTLMATTYGLKPVKFTLAYSALTLREAKEQKSALEAELFGLSEISLPDGFMYRCLLDNIGDEEIAGVDGLGVIVTCAYKFSGIQHDAMVTVADGSSFTAIGTLPKMDCILTVTVGADADTYELGGAVFSDVKAGDVLTVDGIAKRFLKNGAWTTADSWITFPFVKAGNNVFQALDTVEVKYYPCYI